MIQREAEFRLDSIPEPIKDLIWDDQDGFFENAFRWGGRSLLFVAPGPIAIMHTVAGMMGIGLSELGQVLDEKIAGKPLTQSNLVKLATEIADTILPKLEARAAMAETGIVSLAAEPGSKITFETAPPAKTKPAPVLLDPEQPVPGRPKPRVPAPVELPPLVKAPADSTTEQKSQKPKKAPTLKELDPLGFEKARMEIRDEFKQKEHARRLEHSRLSLKDQLLLRQIDEAQAKAALERKKELDTHHAKMENEKFMRDRASMEHQIKTKYEIEQKFATQKQLFDLDKQLILKQITPEQHKLLSAVLNGQPVSDKDLKKAHKSMSRAERDELKRRLEARNVQQKHELAHREKMSKVELRNAKLMAAARGGNKGLISAFKAGVGKAGLVAAIVAILFAGLQMLGKRESPMPLAGKVSNPSSVVDRVPSGEPRDRSAPSGVKPSAAKGKPKSLSKHINNELNSILGG